MAIQGTPTAGPVTTIQESIAAGATSSGTIAVNAILPAGNSTGTTAGSARTLTTTAGGPFGCSVKIDGILTLVGTTPQTIDLTAFTGPGGATKTMTKLRGYHFENENAADLGATGNMTVSGPTTNGQTFGGKWTNSGYPLAPNSYDAGGNLNSSGYTVDATHKLVTVTAGSAGGVFRFCFWGD